jgi:hypothetical protein
VDVKNIKCPLQWWEKHESMFPIVSLCAKQILGIVGSQIETQKKNSLARIFISKCCLQSKKLDKLIFVKKLAQFIQTSRGCQRFSDKDQSVQTSRGFTTHPFLGKKIKICEMTMFDFIMIDTKLTTT